MLGIVFGVFSVIAMLAIGEGASQQAQKQVLQLGATNIICVSVKPPQGIAKAGQGRLRVLRYGLLRKDYELLANTIRTVVKAIPIREVLDEARFSDKAMVTRIVGCTPDYFAVNHLFLDRGRFVSDRDQAENQLVAIIAADVAERLFQFEDPIEKQVYFNTKLYTVVGVTKRREATAAIGGSMSGQDYNKDIYIPLRTMNVQFPEVKIDFSPGSFSAEEIQLSQITLQIDDRDSVIPTAEVVRESLDRNHKEKQDVNVVVPLELLKQADQLRKIFNIVLGSIAAISLVVGGIGIMNIMLATVTERTREIGIRRAMGAKQRDIVNQFLTETIVLSGTGGILGLILGLLTPVAFQGIKWFVTRFVLEGGTAASDLGKMFTNMNPQIATWSLPVAFSISVGIGIVFGLYPAIQAAKLDPIEALRHE